MRIASPLPEFLSPERLRAVLKRHWPAPADETQVEAAPGGNFNVSFFLTHPERSGVLRIAPPDDAGFLFYETRMMAQEPSIHQIVSEETSIPVPAVWAHDDTREILPRDFLVLERLPGTPLSPPAADGAGAQDELLRALGRLIRELHGISGPQFGYLGAHHPMEPERHWSSAFETMWGHLLWDIESCGGYTLEEAARLRDLPYRLRGAFPDLRRASLCHMDLGWENLLVWDGRISGLLDWGRALWGDPEIEFAVLDYTGMSRPAFWEGYGTPRPNDSPARIRRKFYILYELQTYLFIALRRRVDPGRAETIRRAALRLARELESEL
jgi:aminoglycoside phosphotransferase (APT) family kinase protein